MKTLVLYDVDNTLVNSKLSVLARCDDVSQALGLGTLSMEDINPTLGLTGDGRLKYLFGDRFEEAKKAYKLGKAHTDLIKREKGIIEALDYLIKRSISRGIVTNRTENTLKECLEHTNLMQYFPPESIILPRNDGKPNSFFMNTFVNGKPDPEGILMALRIYKTKPCDAVYVGDAPEDMQAAENAGVLFVGYKPTFDCSCRIEDHREIKDFLNK